MESPFEYNRQNMAPVNDLSRSTSRVDHQVRFTNAQTDAPTDLQTHSSPSDAHSMAIASPPPQESPLIPDLGSSSDCSLFAPTPIQTPQDFQEPWTLQAKDTEEELGQILSLDGAWDPTQGPRKYRMLAPKPTTQSTGLAARNIQPQDLTAGATSQTASSAAGQSTCVVQPSGFVPEEECFHPQRDNCAPELLIQQPLVPGLGGFVGQRPSTHLCNAQKEKQSMLFAPRQTFTNTPHNFEVNPCPGNHGSSGNDSSSSEIKPPDDLPSAHQNPFDTFFDSNISETANTDFDSRQFAHGSTSTQTSTFAMQPQRVRQPFNVLDPPIQRGSDSSGVRFQSAAMPTDQATNRMLPGFDDQYLGNSDILWPSSGPTGPANGLIRDELHPSPFDMQPNQSMRDVAMPALSLDDDSFFGQAMAQQPWDSDLDDMMYTNQSVPGSVYPDFYEFNNLGYMPAANADLPANLASSPTDGTRNPALPTTPARTNDLERRDTSRDQQLLDLKRSGLSYKEIKEQYNFPEAESTLRGRYRTLTKTREDRVRKPEWKPADISALIAAVHSLAQSTNSTEKFVWADGLAFLEHDSALNKISWKKVAEMMHEQGCYLYGNATTKKKYVQVREEKLGQ